VCVKPLPGALTLDTFRARFGWSLLPFSARRRRYGYHRGRRQRTTFRWRHEHGLVRTGRLIDRRDVAFAGQLTHVAGDCGSTKAGWPVKATYEASGDGDLRLTASDPTQRRDDLDPAPSIIHAVKRATQPGGSQARREGVPSSSASPPAYLGWAAAPVALSTGTLDRPGWKARRKAGSQIGPRWSAVAVALTVRWGGMDAPSQSRRQQFHIRISAPREARRSLTIHKNSITTTARYPTVIGGSPSRLGTIEPARRSATLARRW
jgi:hypothetical protein